MQLSKHDSFIGNIIELLRKKRSKRRGKKGPSSKMQDYSGLGSVKGSGAIDLDIEKAFKIVCTLESNCGYAIGDSGTSFGVTQVQFGSFLYGLSKDSRAEALTGMSPTQLKQLGKSWAEGRKKFKNAIRWISVSVDENDVKRFMKANPRKVVRRNVTTVKYKPEEYMVVRVNKNGSMEGRRLDLASLQRAGLDVNAAKSQLQRAIAGYITDRVILSGVIKAYVQQQHGNSYLKFQRTFSKKNVKKNQDLRNLADRVSQRNFTNKVRHVMRDVQKSGYNVNAPGAFNIYQLIGIANGSGAGRVGQFLLKRKKFWPGNLHYLKRGNPVISRITGLLSVTPSDQLAGFPKTKVSSLNKYADRIIDQARNITETVKAWLQGTATLSLLDASKIKYFSKGEDDSVHVFLNSGNSELLQNLIPAVIYGSEVFLYDAEPQKYENITATEPHLPKPTTEHQTLSRRMPMSSTYDPEPALNDIDPVEYEEEEDTRGGESKIKEFLSRVTTEFPALSHRAPMSEESSTFDPLPMLGDNIDPAEYGEGKKTPTGRKKNKEFLPKPTTEFQAVPQHTPVPEEKPSTLDPLPTPGKSISPAEYVGEERTPTGKRPPNPLWSIPGARDEFWKLVNAYKHNNPWMTDQEIKDAALVVIRRKYLGKKANFISLKQKRQCMKSLYKCANTLYFPGQYAEDIRSGKRRMTIREGDMPVEENQVAQCLTYSGAHICNVKIISKERMSVTRIRKAFGKKVANALEHKFGPDGQFMVIRFHNHNIKQENDDDYDNNSVGKKNELDNLSNVGLSFQEVIPVEPGAYHASDDALYKIMSARDADHIFNIWKFADDEDELAKLIREQEEEAAGGVQVETIEEERKKEEQKRYEESLKKKISPPAAPEVVPEVMPKMVPEVTPPAAPEKPKRRRKIVEPSAGVTMVPAPEPKLKDILDKEEIKEVLKGPGTFLGAVVEDTDHLEEEFEMLGLDKEEFEKEYKEFFKDELSGLKEKELSEEDTASFKQALKIKDKETVFGTTLSAPLSWPSTIKPPKMSEEAKSLFSVGSIRDGYEISATFMKKEAWDQIEKEDNREEILQNWILPSLLYSVGRKWFERNKKGDAGRSEFKLFDVKELASVPAGQSILDTEKGKHAMRTILMYVTDYANTYFSKPYEERSKIPIAGYIKKSLHRSMMRWLAEKNGYTESRSPICAICKEKNPGSKALTSMELKSTFPPHLWECPECVRISNDMQTVVLPGLESSISRSMKELKWVRGQEQFTLPANIQDVDNPERKAVLKKQLAEATIKRKGLEIQLAELQERRKDVLTDISKYDKQSFVPEMHVWCPNPTCNGQRVPLSFIDWRDPNERKRSEGEDVGIDWKSTEGKEIIKKLHKRFRISPPWSKVGEIKQDAQYATTMSVEDLLRTYPSFHIPSKWMMRLPFICPHDGTEFTIKDAFGKGSGADGPRGGLLWEPWQKTAWVAKRERVGRAKRKEEANVEEMGIATDKEQELAHKELAVYGQKIVAKAYLEEVNRFINFETHIKALGKDIEKVKKTKPYQSRARKLKLFEVATELSTQDPIIYIAWLMESRVKRGLVKTKDGIEDHTFINYIKKRTKEKGSATRRRETVQIPLLRAWLDSMLKDKDAFEKYNIQDYFLTNVESDGIRSFGETGTFFITKVNGEGDGFGLDLQSKRRRGKSRSKPRLLKVLGAWQMSNDELNGILEKTKNFISNFRVDPAAVQTRLNDIKNGTREIPHPRFVTHITGNRQNLVNVIDGNDYDGAAIDKSASVFNPNEYVLVQAYVGPAVYDWAPIERIGDLRGEMDSDNLLFNFGKMIIGKDEDDREFWQQFNKELNAAKNDKEKVEFLLRHKLMRSEAKSDFHLSVRSTNKVIS